MASQEINATTLVSDGNLKAYYRFESNVNDTSSDGYNLTASGTPTYGAGQFGNAIQLATASSQYASIVDASCPNLRITGSITLYGWIKPTDHVQQNFIATKLANDNSGYQLVQNTGGQAVFTGTGLTTNTNVTSTTVMNNGTWYFIVGTYDSVAQTINIYVNGNLEQTKSASGSMSGNSVPFAVGCSFQGAGNTAANFANCALDDVAVWNRALTASEISQLYLGTFGLTVQGSYGFFM